MLRTWEIYLLACQNTPTGYLVQMFIPDNKHTCNIHTKQVGHIQEYICRYIFTYAWDNNQEKKEAVNSREKKEGYMKEFGRRKTKIKMM